MRRDPYRVFDSKTKLLRGRSSLVSDPEIRRFSRWVKPIKLFRFLGADPQYYERYRDKE
jgi:hypothetical protein